MNEGGGQRDNAQREADRLGVEIRNMALQDTRLGLSAKLDITNLTGGWAERLESGMGRYLADRAKISGFEDKIPGNLIGQTIDSIVLNLEVGGNLGKLSAEEKAYTAQVFLVEVMRGISKQYLSGQLKESEQMTKIRKMELDQMEAQVQVNAKVLEENNAKTGVFDRLGEKLFGRIGSDGKRLTAIQSQVGRFVAEVMGDSYNGKFDNVILILGKILEGDKYELPEGVERETVSGRVEIGDGAVRLKWMEDRNIRGQLLELAKKPFSGGEYLKARADLIGEDPHLCLDAMRLVTRELAGETGNNADLYQTIALNAIMHKLNGSEYKFFSKVEMDLLDKQFDAVMKSEIDQKKVKELYRRLNDFLDGRTENKVLETGLNSVTKFLTGIGPTDITEVEQSPQAALMPAKVFSG